MSDKDSAFQVNSCNEEEIFQKVQYENNMAQWYQSIDLNV